VWFANGLSVDHRTQPTEEIGAKYVDFSAEI
jgi:hypothetical protein